MKTPPSKIMLWTGALAGPVFVLSYLIAGATRGNGYEPLRHPVSSLAIGPMGWTQTATFLLSGAILLVGALALMRIKRERGASPWGARILMLCAIGLIGVGFFVCDPLSGYPDGLNTLRAARSASGKLHDAFSALLFVEYPIAAYKFWRMFRKLSEPRWARYALVSGFPSSRCLC